MKSGILNFAVLLSSVNFVSALKCWTTAFGEVVTMADPSVNNNIVSNFNINIIKIYVVAGKNNFPRMLLP